MKIALLRARRCVLLLVAAPAALAAQQGAEHSLAEKSQNPVSDLVSVPLQFNYFTGGGLGGRTLYNLNVQPVVPLPIGKSWNLIARTIVPYLNAPRLGNGRSTGVGDILQQFFVTPAKARTIIWGAGPVLSFPTATNSLARTGDWGLGPAVVVLTMPKPFLVGVLATQVWTIAADSGGADLNLLSVQPFLNLNLARNWTISFSPIITADWQHDGQWTVPLGLGVSNIAMIGKQPVSLGITYFNNVVRPTTKGSSELRFVTSFLFPKAEHD